MTRHVDQMTRRLRPPHSAWPPSRSGILDGARAARPAAETTLCGRGEAADRDGRRRGGEIGLTVPVRALAAEAPTVAQGMEGPG